MAYLRLSLLLVSCLLSACGNPTSETPKPKVAVVEVLSKDVPVYGEIVGQTTGSTDIDIRARVDGQLEGMHFKEGLSVEKGDALYSIDPKPFEANVVSVEGEVAEAKTHLTKTEADLKRIRPLAKMNAVSKRELDAAVANRDAAKAAVESAEAKLDYAKIELGYTEIKSPIDGIIGITKAKVGDYVGREPNPVVLNTVSKIDPIHVKATMSESEYLYFARRYLKKQGSLVEDRKQEEKIPLHLVLSDGSTHDHSGTLYAANSQIDSSTGTLTIEASFPNPEMLIRPGQFAKVRYVQEMKEGAILVWQRAVQELQSVYQVYVVDKDNLVEVRQVEVGDKLQGLWIIEKGLEAGERIIVDGMQRVRPGMQVEALTPEQLDVKPPESPLLRDVAR